MGDDFTVEYGKDLGIGAGNLADVAPAADALNRNAEWQDPALGVLAELRNHLNTYASGISPGAGLDALDELDTFIVALNDAQNKIGEALQKIADDVPLRRAKEREFNQDLSHAMPCSANWRKTPTCSGARRS